MDIDIIKGMSNGLAESTFSANVNASGTLTDDDIVLLATTGIREYDATAASLIIVNTGTRTGTSASDNQIIVPTKITLACSAVNSSGTSTHYATYLDNANRYTSGGTTLTSKSTSIDTRSGYASRTPKAAVYVGALTAAAETTANLQVERGQITDAVHVVGDQIEFVFGYGIPNRITTGTDADGSTHTIGHTPVWIAPGCSFLIHFIMPGASTGGTWHANVQYIETGHPRFNA